MSVQENVAKSIRMDGLRGLAVITVTLCHFFCAFLPTILHNTLPAGYPENPHPTLVFEIFTSPPIAVFYNGLFAIMIFFILSGYVLTMPYFDNPENTLILKRRVYARYLRLNIPIAVSLFIAYFFYKIGFYFNISAAKLAGTEVFLGDSFNHPVTLLTILKEATYQTILSGTELIRPLWTLTYELTGSFLLLGYFIFKPKKLTLFSCVVIVIFFAFISIESVLYLCLFLGAFLNKIKLPKKLLWPAVIMGFYFAAYQQESIFYQFLPAESGWLSDPKAFYSTLGAFFVTLSIVHNWGRQFLESKVPQFFGKISFSLYLLHFIVLCSLSSYLYLYQSHSTLFMIFSFFLYFSISILISIPFNKYIVEFAIAFSNKIGKLMCNAEQGIRMQIEASRIKRTENSLEY